MGRYNFRGKSPWRRSLLLALGCRRYILTRNGYQWSERFEDTYHHARPARRTIKNSNQLNAIIDRWNSLPPCPAAFPCLAGGTLQNVPANINFFSPFRSFDLRLQKQILIRDGVSSA